MGRTALDYFMKRSIVWRTLSELAMTPEGRTGVAAMKVGLPLFVVWLVIRIVTDPGNLRAVALLAVPILAGAAACLFFVVGWATGVLRLPGIGIVRSALALGILALAAFHYGSCSRAEYLAMRAGNRHSDAAELRRIWHSAGQSDAYVQGALARNPNSPRDVLEGLANLTKDDLIVPWGLRLLSRQRQPVILDVVANQETPVEVLTTLATSGAPLVRRVVATSDRIPEEACIRLACDPEALGREASRCRCPKRVDSVR